MSKKCAYCEAENNSFEWLNQTYDYSGIEMCLNRQGMLRVRTYLNTDNKIFESQDIVELKYCPLCGKKFNKDR